MASVKSFAVKALNWLIIGCLFPASGCISKPGGSSITIATAANMQFAIRELVDAFEARYNKPCEVVLGSSGKLAAQIREGAPYDLLISADVDYPTALYRAGITREAPKVYASGKLALLTLKEGLSPTMDELNTGAVRHIALANPKLAPYGRAAVEALGHYGIYEDVASKLVYGESISQTSQFISTLSAEVGFTAYSFIISSPIKEKARWMLLDSMSYTPIDQAAVLIRRENQNLSDVKLFYDFLFSVEAQNILKSFGYSVRE